MEITGRLIHECYCELDEHLRPWDMLTEESQTRYQCVADMLNNAQAIDELYAVPSYVERFAHGEVEA